MSTRWFITVEAQVRPDAEAECVSDRIGMQRLVLDSDDFDGIMCGDAASRRKILDRLVTPLLKNVAKGIEE